MLLSSLKGQRQFHVRENEGDKQVAAGIVALWGYGGATQNILAGVVNAPNDEPQVRSCRKLIRQKLLLR